MQLIRMSFVMLFIAVGLTCQQHAEAQYSIQNSVFGNGGAVVEDSNDRIVGTVGQPMIGMVSSVSNIIYSGFWYLPIPLTLIYGDVSGDGNITAYDAALVLQYVVGLTNLETTQKQAADVTKDGSVTALDAALILQHTVGLITDFPDEITTAAAPTLSDKSEVETLKEKITQLEAIELNSEQKRVLEQIKALVFKLLIPKRTALLQNYPNPFNPETWLPYQLAKDTVVTIRIYNQKGQLVRTLNLGNQKAGIYVIKSRSASWDGKNEIGEFVSSGVYFYHLKAGNFSATLKMLIVK